MKKEPFVTKEQIEEIVKSYPTPFHLYDEKGIRENAKAVKEAFAWNPGFREYFAVKATPNPFLLNILREYGCGADFSSMTELMLAHDTIAQCIHSARIITQTHGLWKRTDRFLQKINMGKIIQIDRRTNLICIYKLFCRCIH